MKTHAVILTCQRQFGFQRVLDDLTHAHHAAGGHLSWSAHNDGEPYNSGMIPPNKVTHYAGPPHGKRQFWRLMQQVFAKERDVDTDLWLFLQDDVRIEDSALARIHRVIECMGRLHYPWAVLDVCNAAPAQGELARWTGETVTNACCWTHDTTWFDLQGWVCNGHFWEVIDRVYPMDPSRWDNNPSLSTGVGKQLSVRLADSPYAVCMLRSPVVHHTQPFPSLLNPHRDE